MARRSSPEQDIQIAVFRHIRARGKPGLFAFHVPMGGYRRPKEAAILKGMGATAGIPDILAIYQGCVYAIELKTVDGRPSEAQYQAIENIRNAGGHAVICYGLDRALKCLETWGLLRGVAA